MPLTPQQCQHGVRVCVRACYNATHRTETPQRVYVTLIVYGSAVVVDDSAKATAAAWHGSSGNGVDVGVLLVVVGASSSPSSS